MRDVDLDCLHLIVRNGPFSPSALAKAAGLPPATVTGVLDRLEKGGWIVRERDGADRRAIQVRIVPERGADVLRQFRGMITAVEDICGSYSPEQLEVIADFLRRTAEAGAGEAERLSR